MTYDLTYPRATCRALSHNITAQPCAMKGRVDDRSKQVQLSAWTTLQHSICGRRVLRSGDSNHVNLSAWITIQHSICVRRVLHFRGSCAMKGWVDDKSKQVQLLAWTTIQHSICKRRVLRSDGPNHVNLSAWTIIQHSIYERRVLCFRGLNHINPRVHHVFFIARTQET
jgi:hypothetical protein